VRDVEEVGGEGEGKGRGEKGGRRVRKGKGWRMVDDDEGREKGKNKRKVGRAGIGERGRREGGNGEG